MMPPKNCSHRSLMPLLKGMPLQKTGYEATQILLINCSPCRQPASDTPRVAESQVYSTDFYDIEPKKDDEKDIKN